jgi:hypothetical protein
MESPRYKYELYNFLKQLISPDLTSEEYTKEARKIADELKI